MKVSSTRVFVLATVLAVVVSSSAVGASAATKEQKDALSKHLKVVEGGGMAVPAKEETRKVEPSKAEPSKAEPSKAEPSKAEPNKAKPVEHRHLHHSAEVEATVKALRAARNSKVSNSLSAKGSHHVHNAEAPKEKAHTAHKHHKRDESLLEVSDKSLAQDKLRLQAHAHARARAKAAQMAALMSGFPSLAFGRGRGGYQRGGGFIGPSEFDNSWWQPPPSVGGDPFLQGYSQKVSPQHLFGYGGMPGGGFGTAHHYWGQGAYKYPLNQPWWRGRSSAYAPAASRGVSPYLPYETPRDSFGLRQPGMGASLPVSSPYYYTPPPLQGDWNLPRNPPPPPAEAAKEGQGS